MIYLKENIKFLRKKRAMTQEQLAGLLDSKRSLIGSYEEGRGVPKLSIIGRMAEIFEVSMDHLLAVDLSQKELEIGSQTTDDKKRKTGDENDFIGKALKVLSVVVTPENDELISIVPVKASAGYLNGRADAGYIGKLPHFSMPVAELSQGRSYRVFQLKGDSMLPLTPGSYIFCDYVEEIADIREGKPYVLITSDEGIVYKRIFLAGENQLQLKSDNPEYEPYMIENTSVLEIWRALGFLSFELPEPDVLNVQKLSAVVTKMQQELAKMKDL
ncbi:MAG: LexA family transcriptional regulator [Mariniphaga sp.]|nr:LexA family transcriptional regulator [Mariniphaga sp.]